MQRPSPNPAASASPTRSPGTSSPCRRRAMDSATRLRDLIVVAGRLITLVTEETRQLEAYKTDEIGALHDEKARLAGLYAGLVRDLKRDPELLAAADKAVRE